MLLIVMLFGIYLAGCNENKQIKESNMSKELNGELEKNFNFIDNILKDEEISDRLYLNDLLNNETNKYFIFIDKEYKSKYFCAYLNIKVKNILDSIEIKSPDGDSSWYIWQGENLYLKKMNMQ